MSLATPATQAAQHATSIIPIVFVNITDPVGQDVVASLAHPGGNVTGVGNAPTTVYGKLIEFLTQLVPPLSRVAIVVDTSLPSSSGELEATTIAANAVGVQLRTQDVRSAEDIDPALAEALAWQPEAIVSFAGPGVVTAALPRLVDFAKDNRIPLTLTAKEFVEAGALLSYGSSKIGEGKAAAAYVHKIINGAKPADLPVERPTVFELAINRTTAAQLGLTIPAELAAQVTDWIQ